MTPKLLVAMRISLRNIDSILESESKAAVNVHKSNIDYIRRRIDDVSNLVEHVFASHTKEADMIEQERRDRDFAMVKRHWAAMPEESRQHFMDFITNNPNPDA